MLSIRPFVLYQTCEYDILKTNEQISMQIGVSGPRSKGMNDQPWGQQVKGQRSKLQEAEVRFGGVAEALFSNR